LQFTSLYDWDRRYQAEYETDQANTLQELTRGPVGPGFALFGFNGTATTATGGPDIDRQFALATFLDRVYVGSIGSEHERGPWDFSWQADYSLARATSDGQYRGRFRIRNVSLDATFGETGYTLRALPVGTRDPGNLANYAFDNLRRVDLNREDTIAAIQGELRRNFEFAGREAFFEAGVKMRNRDAVTGQDVFSFNPQSSAFNAVPNIAVLRGNLSTLAGFDVPSTIAPLGVFPTADAARGRFDAAFQAIGRLVTPALGETFGGDFTLDESTTAYYAMAQFEPLQDFSVLTGVRLEQTDLSTQGYFTQLDNDDNPIPAPGISLVNLGNRGTDYAVVMPHLHVTWRPTDQIDVRASFNRGLQRPDFDDFANRQSYNFVTRDLSAGNPFLDPLIADNFDVQLGWYPNRNTAFQVGFYYKSIQDFFVEYDGPFRNTAGALVTPITPATGIASEPLSIEVVLNGDSATVTGVELNYSQNLTMLPGPLSGLFIASNLTFIDSEAQLTSVRPNETFTLPGQPDILANLSLGYENDWTTVRLAGNYVGESLEEVSGIETLTDANGTTTFQFGRERDVFRNERFSLDLTAQLKFGENVRMTFEASNLTESSDEKVYRGNAATGPIFQQIESFGRTFTFGVNTRF
jgi:TonB-dependent receptor